MADAVDPSVDRTADDRTNGVANRYGHGDWVVPSDRDLVAGEIGLTGAPLNAFDISTSGGSLDVTVDTGESIVNGRYVARDVTTQVTLAANTADQTVYVGTNHTDRDTVTIGLDGAFTSPYSRIALGDFTTDGSGVTSSVERRPIGEPIDSTWHHVAEVEFTSTTSGIDHDTGTLDRPWDRYRLKISHENHAGSEAALSLRVNGVTSTKYFYDIVLGDEGTSTSKDSRSSWGQLATALGGQIAHHTLELTRPRAVAAPSEQYPILATTTPGVAKDRDYFTNGDLRQDPGLIDQIRVFGGSNSTGKLHIMGADV